MSDFKKKVIYQIYPKSFNDSNGDGVGDLPGITQKLPYLSQLGIEMIWLSPIYASPQKDNGYDISDYCQVDPIFGTMDDFEELVTEAKKLGIEIMLDMVLNHTSTEHIWFKKALAGDKKYQDYYLLRPAQADGRLPTNWVSKFGGPAWARFGQTDLYYLHLFDVTQADLNWRNPEVRKELYQVVNFWREKGVHGFRFDVINLIGKDEVLLDDPTGGDGKPMYTDRPLVHEYLKELNEATFGKDASSVTVGEMSATSIENCVLYTQPQRKELSMVFNFHHLKVDYLNGEKWSDSPFNFSQLKELFHSWGETMSEQNGWNALFWNNHDQPRAVSRFGEDQQYRIQSAQMLAATIHLSRGTPYIYQGEEIGMTNPNFETIEEYQDVETLNMYQELIKNGLGPEQVMKRIRAKSRDNSRTPMQWNAEKNAGFTTGTPWMKLAPNYLEVNAKMEQGHTGVYAFYQELIALRKKYAVISDGSYEKYEPDHPSIYAYLRRLGTKRLLVLNNFYAEQTEITIPTEFVQGSVLIHNYAKKKLEAVMTLRPYETLAIYLD